MIDYSGAEQTTNEQAFGFPILPKDTYLVRIEKVTIAKTKTGAVMPKVAMRVEEGQTTGFENNGLSYFPQFVLGTERDPDFEDPQPPDLQNWQARNRAQWKRIVALSGAGVRAASLENLSERLVGCKLWVSVGIKHEKAKGDFDERDVNVILGVFSVAEGPPAARGNGAAGQPRLPRQPTGFVVHDDE